MSEPYRDPMLPCGTSDNDDYFNLPNGRVDNARRTMKVKRPKTTMVWCIECQRHFERPLGEHEAIGEARVEACPEHKRKAEAA